MPRLFRPHISNSIKIEVVMRQLKHRGAGYGLTIRDFSESLPKYLNRLLDYFGGYLDCERRELRLDHNPALALRKRRGTGKNTVYTPAANDPEFLTYREKHAHHIKTNVSGDGAQHPDRVLIKKARQLERGPKPKRQSRFSSPPSRAKKSTWPKRKFETRRNP